MKWKIRGERASRRVWVKDNEIFPGMSQKVFNHSPDGFNWGYGGSGPAQLALALLMLVVDGKTALEYYQDFKWEFVSKWQGDFEDEIDIEKWLRDKGALERTFYVTFGQVHVHSVNGKTFDKNCVAGIRARTRAEAHEKAMKIFNGVFHSVQDEPHLEYYPRGIIDVD